MRPAVRTPAHHSDHLAELVCSNSFRSTAPTNAVGLLKAELEILGSPIMEIATQARIPAGDAFAGNRALGTWRWPDTRNRTVLPSSRSTRAQRLIGGTGPSVAPPSLRLGNS